jgi:NADH-quinone oxidoreductase E subunit
MINSVKGAVMQKDPSKLDAVIESYRGKKGAMIPLLQDVQNLEGYLSRNTMQYVAEALNIPPAEIFGVATFYSMFRLKPMGRHIVRVCKGTACHVSGANGIASSLRENLKLPEGEETTEDLNFTLLEVACLGCCSLAPVIMIDDQTFGKLTPEAIPGILERFAYEGDAK